MNVITKTLPYLNIQNSTHKMRIALIVGGFPVTSETFIKNHVVGLINAGHEVRVYMRRPNRMTDGEEVYMKVNLKRYRYSALIQGKKGSLKWVFNFLGATIKALFFMPSKSLQVIGKALNGRKVGLPRNPLITWKRALPFINSWHPDIVHCHFGTNGLFGAFLKRSGVFRAPLIVTFHGHDVHSVPQKRGFDVYKLLFQNATQITANTHFTAESIVALGCSKHKIKIVPMGFYLHSYPQLLWEPPQKGEPFRILTVARLTEKKGLEYALEAIDVLIQRGIKLRYDIIGDGEQRALLETLITQKKLAGYVFILGWKSTSEVVKYMQASHLFMLPSITATNGDMEGQALVLQEAQAIGLPVVSTWHNGIPEGVRNSETGILVQEKDSLGLANAVDTLCNQPDKMREMSKKAQLFVRGKYDQNRITREWERLYVEACAED